MISGLLSKQRWNWRRISNRECLGAPSSIVWIWSRGTIVELGRRALCSASNLAPLCDKGGDQWPFLPADFSTVATTQTTLREHHWTIVGLSNEASRRNGRTVSSCLCDFSLSLSFLRIHNGQQRTFALTDTSVLCCWDHLLCEESDHGTSPSLTAVRRHSDTQERLWRSSFCFGLPIQLDYRLVFL